ncbi:MAG: 2-C-methyl-D-erythritol 4-phosphate cytidylyltransferase [Lachnospiraceae bacterium]|nr:2-C-methyl-D-erythritol 4-phosphate cytidylyltransferase [Lachnospiraceae bacterium]MDE6184914.1 2-C-methyl-D-erythritol 4-phosphate cytidylyltransferase [Lachnospiraceae bacterium]MDE7286505.1 2-C-methyl-D-erythritol 4-phosphate cytidylyltransferase [Lachnospiraceae bacterium]
MNTALILAGGRDARFKMDIPKQFVNVNNRPIIVYTLEIFQNHPDIDEIIVTCLEGWQEMVRVYGKQFNITKLKEIFPGGKDAQESTYRGLEILKDRMEQGDIVIVHDSIRPMVSEEIITKSIKMCLKKGMGVAATYIMDTIMHSGNGKEGYQSINRYEIMKVQTPQAFDFQLIWNLHQKAIEMNSLGAWDNSSMITNIGEKVYFSEGSDLNLKINTTEDVEMFRALYRMKHPEENIERR